MAAIKTEPGLIEDIQARVIALCEQHPGGISTDMIIAAVPEATPQQCLNVLNPLLKAKRIKLYKKKVQGKEVLLYRLETAANSSALHGADVQEKIVYDVICSAGNKGIWVRNISHKTNIPTNPLMKLLKQMVSKKLIKQVNTVNVKKKVYMKFDLEPDDSVTGGTWYSERIFDNEFADVLTQQCLRFLEKKADFAMETFTDEDPLAQYNAGLVSAEDVLEHILQLGIITVRLSVDDIRDILCTLVYDGKAKEVAVVAAGKASRSMDDKDENEQSNLRYHLAKPLTAVTGLMKVPCGYCPLIGECRDDGPVSPKTCVYMKDWMDKLGF